MKKFALFLIGISALMFILIIFLTTKKNKVTELVEERVKNNINTITYIGVIIGVISIIVASLALIYSIQEPKLVINFKTPHYMTYKQENDNEKIYICQDDDEHVSYELSQPNTWYINIKNEGNKAAQEVKVTITFSDICFIKHDYDYNMTNHMYGIGSFKTLERTYTKLNPDDDVTLPPIPFDKAKVMLDNFKYSSEEIENNKYPKLNKVKMNVDVYVDNIKKIQKSFNLDVKKRIALADGCFYENHDFDEEYKVSEIKNKFAKLQGLDFSGKLDNKNPYMFNLDEKETDEYMKVYNYYLSKLDCYNDILKKEVKHNILMWGRIAYLAQSKSLINEKKQGYSISDIEAMIKNDSDMKKIAYFNFYEEK